MSEDEKKNDIEKPENIIDEIIDDLDDIHEVLVDGASKVGEEIERYKGIRGLWVELGEGSTANPDYMDIYASGVHVLSSARDEIGDIKDRAFPLIHMFDEISPATDSLVSITSASTSALDIAYVPYTDPVFTITDRHEETREKLNQLDPSLTVTYEEIRQVLYGTRADPHRGALFLLRQSFDHFFEILSPDHLVRESPFWTEKEGDDPSLVTREERIHFAANQHIKDEASRKTLFDSAIHMTKVYRALNYAHKRGDLDESKALEALREMQVIIETWVLKIDLESFK
jgi:hypothetical protein